jgi:hypothetical protein
MARVINANDSYRERLLKVIPSEVLGVYMAANGAVVSMDPSPVWLQWVIFVIALAATPLWLIYFQSVRSVLHNVLAGIGFLIWVMALGGPFMTIPGYQPAIGSVFLIVFSGFAAPLAGKLAKA